LLVTGLVTNQARPLELTFGQAQGYCVDGISAGIGHYTLLVIYISGEVFKSERKKNKASNKRKLHIGWGGGEQIWQMY